MCTCVRFKLYIFSSGIVRRSYGTSLELMEQSYHYNFSENHVCLHLPSPILPSAAIHEVNEQCILVTFATEESVYCISLSHPVEMHLVSACKSSMHAASM